jgi:hypothetical protein
MRGVEGPSPSLSTINIKHLRRPPARTIESAGIDPPTNWESTRKELAKAKPKPPPKSNTEIRHILLQYFYDRNRNATSARGKRGSAAKISDVKRELKATHNLTRPQVQSNLTYLLSQGWVGEVAVEKEFQTPRGTLIPSVTSL